LNPKDVKLGVTWLHRAGKILDNDVAIMQEMDFIASVFRYYSSEQVEQ